MQLTLQKENIYGVIPGSIQRGLFGEELVVLDSSSREFKEYKHGTICVSTKLSENEYKDMEKLCNMLGMRRYKFIRESIVQHIKDMSMLLEP